MIYLEKDLYLWHPGELYKHDLLTKARDAERFDRDRFIIPGHIDGLQIEGLRWHQIAMAYKAGFLYEFLKEIHPDWNFKEIAKHMFRKYHVFLSERNLQNYLKHWRNHRNQFLRVSG